MRRKKRQAPADPALGNALVELRRRLALPRRMREDMAADYTAAFHRLCELGLSPEEALERLDLCHLGGFYARPARLWYALDSAARIYPLAMKHGYMAVFRLSVTLKEPILPELLQMALTFTIKRFPSFATTVKRGFFWHYLDATKRRYAVEPERELPCRPLRVGSSGSQSFRVLFHDRRISVEFFHVLTDGSGGMVFLKTLTAEYLRLLGRPAVCGEGVLPIDGLVDSGETENAFLSADDGVGGGSGFADHAALQLGGKLSHVRPCRILHFQLDAELLRQAAKARHCSVTVYLLSLLFVAARSSTDDTQGELSIQVPVNMRKFYPSSTLRNFSLYCGIRLPIGAVQDAEAIRGHIQRQLQEKASESAMREMLRSSNHMAELVRYVPLGIKTPIARLIYGFLGDQIFTCTLSNLGVVAMPRDLADEIESMDFVLGTAISNRASCSLVTFGRLATLSISKNSADPSFEEALYTLLCADGLQPEVEGSDWYEG